MNKIEMIAKSIYSAKEKNPSMNVLDFINSNSFSTLTPEEKSEVIAKYSGMVSEYKNASILDRASAILGAGAKGMVGKEGIALAGMAAVIPTYSNVAQNIPLRVAAQKSLKRIAPALPWIAAVGGIGSAVSKYRDQKANHAINSAVYDSLTDIRNSEGDAKKLKSLALLTEQPALSNSAKGLLGRVGKPSEVSKDLNKTLTTTLLSSE